MEQHSEELKPVHAPDDETKSSFLSRLPTTSVVDEYGRFLFKNSPALNIIIDTRGDIIDINDKFLELSGYSAEELIGQPALNFVTEKYQQVAIEKLQSAFIGAPEPEVELEIIKKDTGHFTVLFSETGFGFLSPEKKHCVLFTALDITERKKLYDNLLASEAHYRSFVENTPEPIIRTDMDGQYIFANNAFIETTGLKREELLNRGLTIASPLIHPEDMEKLLRNRMAVLTREERHQTLMRMRLKDGQWHWIDHLSFPWYTPDGQMGGAEAIGRDVTEQIQAQQALERRDAILSAVAEMAHGLLISNNWADGLKIALHALSHAAQSSCASYLDARSVGNHDILLYHKIGYFREDHQFVFNREDVQGFSIYAYGLRSWIQPLLRGEPVADKASNLSPREEKILLDFGVQSCAVAPIFIENQFRGFLTLDEHHHEREWSPVELEALKAAAGIIGVALQRWEAEKIITEQHSKMAVAERLSSLGIMASGVAHEINNPLATISIGTEQLQRMLQDKQLSLEVLDQTLTTMRRNIERIDNIVRGLRQLSRDGHAEGYQSESLGHVVTETLKMCQSKFQRSAIDLRFPDSSENYVAECNPTLISQVIMNLLHNAYDAVNDLEDGWVSVQLRHTDYFVEVVICNNGPTIDPALSRSIFEPFYTTKDVGKGTGLGLSISKTIAESHHGELLLDRTAPDTCFVLRLPKKQPVRATE